MRERILRQPGGMGLSLRSKSRRRIFHPSFVPEIARGYFWEVASAVGLGTAGFLVPEGNGRTPFDLVQATVANQPTLLTENGGRQFRMGKSGSSNPARLAVAGNVVAGWTGPTYVGMWVRLPDASGDITGTGGLFRHNLGAGTRRMQFNIVTGPDEISSFVCADGTTTTNRRWASPFVGVAWLWLENIFDPLNTLGGSTDADRDKLFSNLVEVAVGSVNASAGASLFDATAPLIVGCQSAVASNADTTDWAACYYCNGIPTLANRVKLANRMNPTGILLAA